MSVIAGGTRGSDRSSDGCAVWCTKTSNACRHCWRSQESHLTHLQSTVMQHHEWRVFACLVKRLRGVVEQLDNNLRSQNSAARVERVHVLRTTSNTPTPSAQLLANPNTSRCQCAPPHTPRRPTHLVQVPSAKGLVAASPHPRLHPTPALSAADHHHQTLRHRRRSC